MRPQVLIVEDNPDLVRLLVQYLSRREYEVKAVMDGPAGKAELCTGYYDVCLLDLEVPGLSGQEVLKAAKTEAAVPTAVIMMTGTADFSAVVECMRLGAADWLRKPFQLDELALCVEKGVRNYRLVTESARYGRYLEEEVSKKTEELKKTYFDMVRAFAESLSFRDRYTGGHSRRVSELAVLFGRCLGLDEKKLQEVRVGGMLHDLGKIGVEDRILLKPGLLTSEEFEAIRKHPSIGHEIIRDIESMKSIVPYVLCHHERYDGQGYPAGLTGEAIPVEGRLICLADALDAMRSTRSYRPPLTLEKTLDEVMKNCGTQFDPGLVKVFRTLWDKGELTPILAETGI